MNRRRQRRRRVKGGQPFLASVERNEEFLHLKRHKDDKGSRLKQIPLSLTQTCCSVSLADYKHKKFHWEVGERLLFAFLITT